MFAPPTRRQILPYCKAIGFVVPAFCARLLLEPAFGPGVHVFSLFYLSVVFAAYFGGTMPAIVAALLSAASAYWAFATPAFAWKIHAQPLIALFFFALTSAVDIYFITGMRRAMLRYRLERTRAEILAQGHAALFHEYNERAANHLQLLAALLNNEGEVGPDSSMIAEASRHAILLSSVHRSLSPHSVAETDFADFARELLENSVRAAGMPFIAVEVRGDQLQLPSDRAASLAILLFEWTRLAIPGLVQARNPRLAIAHEARADTQILSLSALGWSGESTELAEHELSRQIVTAMADHLGGYLEMSDEGGILRFGLRFPLSPEQPLQGSMPEPMIWAQTTPTLQ